MAIWGRVISLRHALSYEALWAPFFNRLWQQLFRPIAMQTVDLDARRVELRDAVPQGD